MDDGRWALEDLQVENFRCFDHISITLDDRCTVLVGDNGAGKTALLEAIAVMMSTLTAALDGDRKGISTADARSIPVDLESMHQVAHMEVRYPVQITATALIDGVRCTWSRQRASRRSRTTWAANAGSRQADIVARKARGDSKGSVVLPVLAYYGIDRLQERQNRGALSMTRFSAYQSCLESHSDTRRLTDQLMWLSMTVMQAEARGDPEPRAAKRQIEALDLACRYVLEPTGWRGLRVQSRQLGGLSLRHDIHGILPINRLAAGIRISALLALDIASRAARANPALGADELLSRVPGIVLIDEIDLHLHPKWQKSMVDQLLRTFPNIQFVLTSHSPLVVSQRPPSQIRNLDHIVDSKVQPPRHSRGLSPEVILREVLDTQPLPEDVEERLKLRRYLELVNSGCGETEDALSLRRELEEKLGTAANIPEFADADAQILFDRLPD